MFVREFIGPKRSNVVGNVANQHSVELFFHCELDADIDRVPRDVHHRAVEWVDLKQLSAIPIFPKTLAQILVEKHLSDVRPSIYLGDVD
jgi:hypothetical protein